MSRTGDHLCLATLEQQAVTTAMRTHRNIYHFDLRTDHWKCWILLDDFALSSHVVQTKEALMLVQQEACHEFSSSLTHHGLTSATQAILSRFLKWPGSGQHKSTIFNDHNSCFCERFPEPLNVPPCKQIRISMFYCCSIEDSVSLQTRPIQGNNTPSYTVREAMIFSWSLCPLIHITLRHKHTVESGATFSSNQYYALRHWT